MSIAVKPKDLVLRPDLQSAIYHHTVTSVVEFFMMCVCHFCRYFKRCEGSWSNHTWTVFWYGISNPKLSYGVVDWAVNHKTSFIEAEEQEDYDKEDSEVAEPW